MDEEKVIFKEEQKNILQVMLYDDKRKSLFISKGQLISKCPFGVFKSTKNQCPSTMAETSISIENKYFGGEHKVITLKQQFLGGWFVKI